MFANVKDEHMMKDMYECTQEGIDSDTDQQSEYSHANIRKSRIVVC